MASNTVEFRTALKCGKRSLKQGDAGKAERWLLRAYEIANDSLKDDNRKSFVLHRLAELSVMTNEPMVARRRFKVALKLVNKNDYVGYALLLRDYGEFERRQGHPKIARKHVEKAARLLSIDTGDTRRSKLELERVVTKGFVARLDLSGRKRAEAIDILKWTARELYGTPKVQYELANLAILVEVLPIWDISRTRYILRAMALSIQLRNHVRATEFALLLGGKPLRGTYRLVTK